eukprot:604315_1
MRIQIVDTVQQMIRYGPSLAYETRDSSVVIVHNILYCFGGNLGNGINNNKWQYLNLIPTVNPTKNPTENPTVHPTVNPSVNPTMNPSINPTMNPTENPSINPTVDPTLNPFVNPTINPSLYPTTHPTINPANVPGRDGQVHEVTTTTFQDNDSPEDAIKRDKKLLATEYSIFISISALLCIALCGIYVLHRRQKMHEVMTGNIVEIQCVEPVIAGNNECDEQSKEYGVHVPDGKEKDTSVATTGFDASNGNFGEDAMNFVNAAEMDQVVLGDDDVNTCGNTEK